MNFTVCITDRNNQLKITDKVKNVRRKLLTDYFKKKKKNLIEESHFVEN